MKIMKKYFATTITLLLISIAATFGQKKVDELKEVELVDQHDYKEEQTELNSNSLDSVNELTMDHFTKDFSDARKVNISKTKNYYQVSFREEHKNMKAYYDFNGQLVGITKMEVFRDLPANARYEIINKYKGYAIVKVFKFEINKDNKFYLGNDDKYMTLYGNRFEKQDSYFVELTNNDREIVLKIDATGDVVLFSIMK
jgi:hypothetical protein